MDRGYTGDVTALGPGPRREAASRLTRVPRDLMPRPEDATAESGGRNATLCGNCSKALQKPLVCARCQTATYCSKDCQVHTAHRKRGGFAIKAVIE